MDCRDYVTHITLEKMKDRLLYTNLLIILQNFENLWNMYSISGGLLYRSETKKSAKIFLEIFNKVADKHPAIRNTKELHINSTDSTEHIDSVNQFLKEWTEGDEKFPIPSTELGISDNEKSRYILQSIFMCLSAYLLCKVQLEYNPILCKSSGESSFHQNNVKWNERFSWQISDQVDKLFLNKLSENETVVIIGDIRKSQDLITYSSSPDAYRSNMVFYIEKVRKIILDNNGVFDRFTGDGFICYFNAYLSQMFRKDLYQTVIDVCVKIQKESKPYFGQWQQNLQKIPQDSIGLSIGIDSGIMTFLYDRMMFAVGTPAVWATRMCTAGNAGDIIINNIPHAKISNGNYAYSFDEVFSSTKTGEQFKAFRLKYE